MKLILDGEPEEIFKFLMLMDADEDDDADEELSADEKQKINVICDVAGAVANAAANAVRKHFND